MMDIGNEIRRLRQEKGWSQARLAERSGVSVQTISFYETHKFIPNAGTVEMILNAMGHELCIREIPK